MVRALRVVTVERGVDPRRFALLPFGGAGPMHAAAIAAELEIGRILCPRAGGVLSALGLCASDRRRDTTLTVMLGGEELTAERVAAEVDSLVEALGGDLEGAEPEVFYEMRYAGQAFELPIPGDARPDPADLVERFERAHEERYGHRDPDGEVVLVHIRLAMVAPGPRPELTAAGGGDLARATVRSGSTASGSTRPSCVASRRSASPRRVRSSSSSRRRRSSSRRAGRHGSRRPARSRRRCGEEMSGLDPITLQVMVGGLRAACDEMGATLIRSAYSANIKERQDCSTALFDPRGELVMQAEHIPVHLGSMPDAVAAVLDFDQRPGESWILNDPFRGGTHLPDITIVSPVFVGGVLLGFAACRAHHADVGGPTAAGMPASSARLADEGVVIPPMPASMHELRDIAAQMRFPSSGSPTFAPSGRRTGSAPNA